MFVKPKKHKNDLYNILLKLSRNIFFYTKIKLPDSFETRILLMFIHFSILMIISKKKGSKFNQENYDFLFNCIENDLRELGFGDVTVNKKMKELNKILYDILLKIELDHESNLFKINYNLIFKYFDNFKGQKSHFYRDFELYFLKFYNFCFELPVENMVSKSSEFTNNF